METTDSHALVLHGGEVALLVTVVSGVLLYAVIRLSRQGQSSLVRSLLASLASSAVVVACVALSALGMAQSGALAALALIFNPIVGILLTLPVQLLILGLPASRGIVVWIAYVVATPLFICWVLLLSAWAGIS